MYKQIKNKITGQLKEPNEYKGYNIHSLVTGYCY